MEAFHTIQGEGLYAGQAAHFIRLGGCDVGCTWCDVKESWEAGRHPLKQVDALVAEAIGPLPRALGAAPRVFPAGAFYELAGDQQRAGQVPSAQPEPEKMDASINHAACTNRRALDRFPPSRLQGAARAQNGHRELFYNRAAAADDPA